MTGETHCHVCIFLSSVLQPLFIENEIRSCVIQTIDDEKNEMIDGDNFSRIPIWSKVPLLCHDFRPYRWHQLHFLSTVV